MTSHRSITSPSYITWVTIIADQEGRHTSSTFRPFHLIPAFSTVVCCSTLLRISAALLACDTIVVLRRTSDLDCRWCTTWPGLTEAPKKGVSWATAIKLMWLASWAAMMMLSFTCNHFNSTTITKLPLQRSRSKLLSLQSYTLIAATGYNFLNSQVLTKPPLSIGNVVTLLGCIYEVRGDQMLSIKFLQVAQ